MDIKRLFIALVLSFVFMQTYLWLFGTNENVKDNNSLDSELVSEDLEAENSGTKEKFKSLEKNNGLYINEIEELDVNDLLGYSSPPTLEIKTDVMKLLLEGGANIQNIFIIERINGPNKNYKYTGRWESSCADSQNNANSECLSIYNKTLPVQVLNSDCNPCLYVEHASGVQERILFHLNIDEYPDSTLNAPAGVVLAENQYIIYSKGIGKDGEMSPIYKETTVPLDSYVVTHKFTGLDPNKNVFLRWSGGVEPTESKISYGVGGGLSVYVEEENSYASLATLNDPEALPDAIKTKAAWGAVWTKYFQKAITHKTPESLKTTSFSHNTKKINNKNPDHIYTNITSRHKGSAELEVQSYIGPIDPGHFSESPHLDHLFYGKWYAMGPLKRLIVWLLTTLGDWGLNYGVVCILFAFLIRLFTGPLTKKSFLANQRMQALQPKIKKLQEKYKDDKQKASQETMALYKTEGVNPLGGCLPILIQMPLLIALFQAFQNTIEFRGASFISFWIPDLSQPDMFISTDFFTIIPWVGDWFFGHGISLLPIIMGTVMFLNMKMSSPVSSEGSSKLPMYFMNVFFVLLFNTFPAGLNLYYTAYNILNFIQQKKLKEV